MNWMPFVTLIAGAVVGYLFGIMRDRSAVVRSKKIETIERLHERVLEIEKMELSDGKSSVLHVSVVGGKNASSELLSDEEVDYSVKQQKWRDELREEERRARLWIDHRTVDIISNYFLLMMQCSSWDKFGQGNLVSDDDFLERLKNIFGSSERVLETIVITHSQTGKPRLVNLILLSHLCLNVIQKRVKMEVSQPLFHIAMSFLRNRFCKAGKSRKSDSA